MAVIQVPTSDGVKLKDSDSGELRGSIGVAKNGIPTMAPVLPTLPEKETPMADHIDSLHERFLVHQEALAGAVSTSAPTITSQPCEEVAYGLARALPTDLNDAQFVDICRLLHQGVQRISKELKKASQTLEPPTDAEWDQWITSAQESIDSGEFDLETHERLIAQLGAAISDGKPDAYTFAIISKLSRKIWAAKYSLDEGYRQISAWFDVSPVEVKRQIVKFQNEYLALEELGMAPDIDPIYSRGYKMTSGSSPKDDATVYGHWMAGTPELYDPSAVPTKFVAMDTETTGLDKANDRVIQIGLVEYDHNGVEQRRFVSYIRPPADENGVISTGGESAVNAHGIHPADVADAPTFEEVAPIIREYFNNATVIGQNLIQFDAAYIKAEYMRLPDADENSGKNIWPRAADTLWHIHRWIDKDGLGLPNRKLDTMTNHFGLPAFNAHDAGADAHATGLLFFHLRKPLKERQMAAYEKRRSNDAWNV
jgi:DNA polymerase III epsilon subunit-like protein